MSSPLIRRGFVARIDDASTKDRTVTAVITADSIDSYGEVILPKGIDLRRYRKNPIVLWAHGQDPQVGALPIGKNLWIKPGSGDRTLVARTQFADTERGHDFFALYEQEVLRAWSIGANEPNKLKNGPPVARELRERPDWGAAKKIYRATELIEYSSVHVGANPQALTTAIGKGLWLPDCVRALLPADEPDQADEEQEAPEHPEAPSGPELPAFVARSFAEVHRAAVARIRAAAGRIATDEADRLAGRV